MKSRASVTVMVTWVCVKESSNIQSGWREGKVNLRETENTQSCNICNTHTLPIQAVLHLKVQIKCLLITGTGETWWREAARCGWRCPCSEARGRLRGRAWRRSTGSFPSTGTEAQLWQNNVRTEGSGDSRRVQFFSNVICFDGSHNDEKLKSKMVWVTACLISEANSCFVQLIFVVSRFSFVFVVITCPPTCLILYVSGHGVECISLPI